jgi:basic amino acid/polyamine antiporter, APA family
MTRKTLGITGTIFIGLASMLGAGVFVVFRDAYVFSGSWLFAALGLAALVAALNSASIYQLARQVDRPGGTYAYARVYRNDLVSFLAGFAFVFGKIGSIAAIALVFGEYVAPGQKQVIAVAAILVMVCVNVLGIQRTALVASVLAMTTSGFLIFTIAVGLNPLAGVAHQFATYYPSLVKLPLEPGWGIVTGASLIFFAFAGYARVATLGNEVRDAKRNIPRAIALSLSIVLAIYLLLALVLTHVLGTKLAEVQAPFTTYFAALGMNLNWLVIVVAAMASLGSILALLAGVSRTAAEMAADRELPKFFEARNRFGSPWVAEVMIAVGASSLVFVGDLSSVIGFSSFSVLFYYALAHLSALGQPRAERLLSPVVQILGFALCLLLALSVPGPAVVVSTLILVVAIVIRRLFRVESK